MRKNSPTSACVARVERPGRRQVVDEEPVALVGRDAPGRRVRLDEVALLLEHGHLVADGGRRHLDAGRVGDVGRAHRLRRGDVLLHDGAQDRGLAFVEHVWQSRLPSANRPCAEPGPPTGEDGDRPGGRDERDRRCRRRAPTGAPTVSPIDAGDRAADRRRAEERDRRAAPSAARACRRRLSCCVIAVAGADERRPRRCRAASPTPAPRPGSAPRPCRGRPTPSTTVIAEVPAHRSPRSRAVSSEPVNEPMLRHRQHEPEAALAAPALVGQLGQRHAVVEGERRHDRSITTNDEQQHARCGRHERQRLPHRAARRRSARRR